MALGIMSVALINAYLNALRGAKLIEIIPILLMPLLMCVSAIIFPKLSKKKRQKESDQERLNYEEKINKLFDNLAKELESDYRNNLAYLNSFKINLKHIIQSKTYFSIDKHSPNYLSLDLGHYNRETKIKIEGDYSSDYVDKLINDLYKRYQYYPEVPYILDLKTKAIISCKVKASYRYAYFNNILMTLALSHNYADLKIALVIDDDYDYHYLNLKEIPHLYLKGQRLIFKNIEDLYRLNYTGDLIILSLKLLDLDKLNGHKLIFFSEQQIMPKSDLIISFKDYLALIEDKDSSQTIIINYFKYFNEKLFYYLRLYTQTKKAQHQYLLTELCKPTYLSKLKQLLLKQASIYASFGYDFNGNVLEYDISDEGIGPHMLVVGASGSGKSNFIIAFLINLAYRYRASDLAFAIVDYKGSGLIDSLSYNNQMLPHIAMSVNDIDGIEFDRSLSAFRLECKRREKLFKGLAKVSGSAILCLKDYLSTNPNLYNYPNLSNILIVIDEFAELKKTKAEFLSEVISIARIGRSLGIYLLLATQKATAVVDEEILANTNIKLALKLQNESESVAIINSKVAADIENIGEFYLRFNNQLVHGQSIYARDFVDKRNLEEVKLLDESLKVKDYRIFKSDNPLRSSSKVIEEILANDHSFSHQIFIKQLVESDYLSLLLKYKTNNHELLIGEYDDFSIMRQDALKININKEHLVLFAIHGQNHLIKILDLLILNLIRVNKHVIVIAEDKIIEHLNQKVETIHLEDQSDLDYLMEMANHYCDLAIIYANYNLMVNSDNRHYYEEKLNRLMKDQLVIVLSTNVHSYSLRLINMTRAKYLINVQNKDEIMYYFGTDNHYAENNLYLDKERLIGFKYPIINDFKFNAQRPYLKHIPDIIANEVDHKRFLLGYDLRSRNKVYIANHAHFLVISYYDEILERFKHLYPDKPYFEYYNYHALKRNQVLDNFIWLGPNITNQYLFIPDNCKSLNDDECYLEIGTKGRVIKYRNQ